MDKTCKNCGKKVAEQDRWNPAGWIVRGDLCKSCASGADNLALKLGALITMGVL